MVIGIQPHLRCRTIINLERGVALRVVTYTKPPSLPSHVPWYLFADCSVCSKNYVSSLNFICRKCYDSAVGFAIAVVVTVLIAAVGRAIVSYLLSAERSDAGRTIAVRVAQSLPMQSVKNVIVVWQILTQVRAFNGLKTCSSEL